MNYEIIEAVQGSEAWHQARKDCFTASEAPAANGVSKYQTRDELLTQKKTGIVKEVDVATQRLFERGHETEALARVIAEEIIGEELYPITAKAIDCDLPLLASMDGLTLTGDYGFEHKLLSQSLIEQIKNNSLEPHYTLQMDQQILVTGCEKILFMTSDGTKENCHWMWYESSEAKQTLLLAGWEQFERDLAAYVPPVQIEKVVAESVEALPVPSVVVKGELVSCNLTDITPKFDAYLGSVNTVLATDQDFADAESNAKNCRETAKRIEALQENIISQMVSVNEVNSALENYKARFNTLALRLEKAVKEQKESLKTAAIMTAQQAFTKHVSELEAETKPIRLNVQMPDFGGAIKGVKTVTSMQSRINYALYAGKMKADAVARDIRAKQAWLKQNAEGFDFLLSDIHTIIYKAMDDLQLLVTSRIAAHKEAKAEEAKKMQAQAEEAARAKLATEQKAKEQTVTPAKQSPKAQQINEAKPEVAQREAVTLPGQDQVSEKQSSLATIPASVYYPLFEHMANEHGLTLMESELQEIVRISVLVNDRMHQNADLFEVAA